MRIIFSVGVLYVLSSFVSLGQDVAQSVAPTVRRLAPTVVARGPHNRLWETRTLITDEKGGVTTHTNSFTELATGMHYWNGV